jgi:hypothetical protein
MHVTGAAYGADIPTLDRVQVVTAERRAEELFNALQSALMGDPHWRPAARALVRKITEGEMPNEPRR